MGRNHDHERDYDLPPILMQVYRHPRTRVLHFRSECKAMTYGRKKMIPLLIRADLHEEMERKQEEVCRFCFGW